MANRVKILEQTIHVGDTIKVHHSFFEKDKKRTQVFIGLVIRIKGSGINKSFTVRKIATGAIGVERIWPINSPVLEKIEVVKKGKVRRAKLYYLRNKIGKKATRVKSFKENKPTKKQKANNEKEKPGKSGRKPSSSTSKK